MKKRVSAIILDDNKILLIRRVKPGIEYYTFPGGTVEEEESIEHAMRREIKEELSVDAKIDRLLFEIESDDRKDYFFLIESVMGVPKLGGPEAERMNADNQYHIEWVDIEKLKKMTNFYPTPGGVREKIISFLENRN